MVSCIRERKRTGQVEAAGQESTCNVENLGLIPGLGRSPGEGKDYPLQCFGLENSMDSIVHGVAKNRTRLGNLHFHCTLVTAESKRAESGARVMGNPSAVTVSC